MSAQNLTGLTAIVVGFALTGGMCGRMLGGTATAGEPALLLGVAVIGVGVAVAFGRRGEDAPAAS